MAVAFLFSLDCGHDELLLIIIAISIYIFFIFFNWQISNMFVIGLPFYKLGALIINILVVHLLQSVNSTLHLCLFAIVVLHLGHKSETCLCSDG